MSHDTHHTTNNKSKVPSISSFWLILILAGVFVAAVNFVNVMSHDEGEHGDNAHGTESHSADTHHDDEMDHRDIPQDVVHDDANMYHEGVERGQPEEDH